MLSPIVQQATFMGKIFRDRWQLPEAGEGGKTEVVSWMPVTRTSPESLILSSWYPKSANTTLRPGLHLYVDGITVEVRVQGLGVYTELLADTVI
jgi:hypothetical protein